MPAGPTTASAPFRPVRRQAWRPAHLSSLPFLAVLVVLLLPHQAACRPEPVSAVAPSPGGPCRAAIEAAESAHHIPDAFLSAIARVESGRTDPATGLLVPWPWTINAEGAGSFFATKAEAIAAVRTLQARGVRSIDVGCLQVNLLQHPEAFASLDQAFDPAANAGYAAGFLVALFGGTHSWPLAAAAYHSQTATLGAAYQRRVLAEWAVPDLGGLAGVTHATPRSPAASASRAAPAQLASVPPAPVSPAGSLPTRGGLPVRPRLPFTIATGRNLAAYRGMPTQLVRALPRKAG